jgi:hypothetical protein
LNIICLSFLRVSQSFCIECCQGVSVHIREHRNQLGTENMRSNSEEFFRILRGFFVQINCRRYDHGARHYLL